MHKDIFPSQIRGHSLSLSPRLKHLFWAATVKEKDHPLMKSDETIHLPTLDHDNFFLAHLEDKSFPSQGTGHSLSPSDKPGYSSFAKSKSRTNTNFIL